MEEGTLRDHETQLLTREGDALDVSLSASLLRDNSAEIQGKLIVCRDITESKHLESQLRFGQRMEAIGTLAGGIAHNFNNLLMGIQGNSTLMMLDSDPEHPNYKRILNIEKHIQSGSRLTRQLIGYAREGKYQVQAIDLNHVIREIAEAFILSQKRAQINFHLDPLLPGMLADRGQLEQVLMNLLVNAVDAMPDGGQITIDTHRIHHDELTGKPYQPAPGQYICLSVSDTGSGMDEATRKRVFEPFFTTKGLDRGSGLGLASCYGIIKAHGGYIDVESQPGQGSCFTIYFPGTDQPVDAECQENDQCFIGTETILVVDDEAMILEVTREMLEQLGYRVLSAESGGQAIRIYQEQGAAIDMVILDMIMPEMGGDQAFEALRRLDPEIKVLLASGYSMEGKAAALLDQGCLGYIQKPFSLPDLSLKLREILDYPQSARNS
ncbi:MAG: ATP-binding protein, partial [Desulfobacterales bacterium]